MKNFRILFVLLIACSFSIVNAQTANLKQVSNKICTQKRTVSTTKTITPQTPPQKYLAVSKQRRLKSFQSNHKIARKRKSVITNKAIAAID